RGGGGRAGRGTIWRRRARRRGPLEGPGPERGAGHRGRGPLHDPRRPDVRGDRGRTAADSGPAVGATASPPPRREGEKTPPSSIGEGSRNTPARRAVMLGSAPRESP